MTVQMTTDLAIVRNLMNQDVEFVGKLQRFFAACWNIRVSGYASCWRGMATAHVLPMRAIRDAFKDHKSGKVRQPHLIVPCVPDVTPQP